MSDGKHWGSALAVFCVGLALTVGGTVGYTARTANVPGVADIALSLPKLQGWVYAKNVKWDGDVLVFDQDCAPVVAKGKPCIEGKWIVTPFVAVAPRGTAPADDKPKATPPVATPPVTPPAGSIQP
jgi:hypothetical protein